MSAAVQQAIDEINVRIAELETTRAGLQRLEHPLHIFIPKTPGDPENGPAAKYYAYGFPSRPAKKATEEILAPRPPQALSRREYQTFTYRPCNSLKLERGRITVDDIEKVLEGGPMKPKAIVSALMNQFPMLTFDGLKRMVNSLLSANRNRFHRPGASPRAAWRLKHPLAPKLVGMNPSASEMTIKPPRARSKNLVTVAHLKRVLEAGPMRTKEIAKRVARQVPNLSPMTVYNAVCLLLKEHPDIFKKCGFGGPLDGWILCDSKVHPEESKFTPITYPRYIHRDEMDRVVKVSVDVNEEAYKAWEKPEVTQPTFTPKPVSLPPVKSKSAPAPVSAETLAKIALAQARVDRLRERVISPRTEMMTRAAVRQLEDDFEAATNELEALKEGVRS